MTNKILINAVDPEECRIAKVKDSKLEEFHIETAAKELAHGNIYKAVVARVEPSLQAVFVDYGAERHGFLQKQEIHSDYFLDTDSGGTSIKSLIKRGQELMVQVNKEAFMQKGAMLTTNISLPGRYVVLMPGNETRGISRKIASEDDRNALKKIINSLKLPEEFGVIIRTAGANCTKTQINKDLRHLLRLWKSIKAKVMKKKSPTLLYKERSLALRSIRDYFTPDVTEILIDDKGVYTDVVDFLKIISPKHTKIVKLYSTDKPIFSKFELENQIASIFENRVDLKSGGSIVIEQTEALVAIDVNSGKATQQDSVEKTALQTNLEAAEEIARQLRLRDLGGLIVLDFIDMKSKSHHRKVEKTLKDHMKTDKAKINIARISKFGLIEMSRQRLRLSIEYGSFEPCRYCRGKGLTPSPETLGVGFLRKLSLETLKEGNSRIKGIVPTGVAVYILNKKRKELIQLETRHNVTISIEADPSMVPGESNIICEN